MPTTDTTFGYSYIGASFREVVRFVPGGFVFGGKSTVHWSEIVGYRAFPDFYPDRAMAALGSPKPRIALYVRDGRIILIRGDVLVAYGKPMVRANGIPEAFSELVNHLREIGVPRWA